MQVYLVANPKGGAGKSTLSTNLAGMLAWRGLSSGARVLLGDVDRQQSSRFWLDRRPPELPKVDAWLLEAGSKVVKPPRGTTHVVLDTPAGMHGDRLKECIRLADKVLVPVQPSMFDIMATQDFFDELAHMKAAQGVEVGLIGMRMHDRTHAADEFHRYIEARGLPLIATLRDTQNYVHLAAHGMTLFDVTPSRVSRDLDQWKPIEKWLNSSTLAPTLD